LDLRQHADESKTDRMVVHERNPEESVPLCLCEVRIIGDGGEDGVRDQPAKHDRRIALDQRNELKILGTCGEHRIGPMQRSSAGDSGIEAWRHSTFWAGRAGRESSKYPATSMTKWTKEPGAAPCRRRF
jgi:hypothetical protein